MKIKNRMTKKLCLFFLIIYFGSLSLSCNAKSSVLKTSTEVQLPEVKEGQALPSDIFIQLAKKLNPSVVNIYTETTPKFSYSEGMPDSLQMLLEQFMGGGLGGGNNPFGNGGGGNFPKPQPAQSLGTGFIIRENGLILTNAHVVDKADLIKVKLIDDDKEYQATVIGKDLKTDVALIKITTTKKLIAAKLGSSKLLQVGEWVAAFGNPYGHSHTMTKGIVSAIGRDSGGLNLFPFIQTDTSINPGNSGGPLVNLKGEVVGMNTAIDARAQGIGFAIPIDNVKELLSELEKTGEVKRGFLGIEMQDLDEPTAKSLNLNSTQGALVVNVLQGSAAANAGLKSYDVITKFGNYKITSSADIAKAVSSSPIGSARSVEIFRNGTKKILSVTLGSQSKEVVKNYRSNKTEPENKSVTLDNLGLTLSDQSQNSFGSKPGVWIAGVKPYSPAFNAGLKAGDIILEINKKPIKSLSAFKRELKNKSLLRIQRGGRTILVLLSVSN